MGVPLLDAMYGNWAGDLVVQLAVFQAVTWLTLLLFVLELKKALEEMREETVEDTSVEMTDPVAPVELTRQVTNGRQITRPVELTCQVTSGHQVAPLEIAHQVSNGREENVNERDDARRSTQVVAANDLESGNSSRAVARRFSIWSLMKVVGWKLALTCALCVSLDIPSSLTTSDAGTM